MELTHTAADSSVIASFSYELDGVGNRITATETIRQPGELEGVEAFLEENGLLVLEAESGNTAAGTSHDWISQTVQPDYAGAGYLRALPDMGQLYEASEISASPAVTYPIYIANPGTYTVWVRGMAPDATGDSLHVGLDGQTTSDADQLTGFAANEWSWSALTMDNITATLPSLASGNYNLDLWLREDGLRLDKVLLTTDPDYVPSGQGPAESARQAITGTTTLQSVVIAYDYDPLYRLTEAAYTGDITATYSYDYDAAGNRQSYTVTLATTEVTTYTYNAANQLETAKLNTSADTWYYAYDGNGNQVRQVPNGLTPAAGEVRYTFDQRNRLVRIENHDGSDYQSLP